MGTTRPPDCHFQQALRILRGAVRCSGMSYVATAFTVSRLSMHVLATTPMRAKNCIVPLPSIRALAARTTRSWRSRSRSLQPCLQRRGSAEPRRSLCCSARSPFARRTSDPEHRDVARTLADLASTLMQVGRPERAQQLASARPPHLGTTRRTRRAGYATVLALYARAAVESRRQCCRSRLLRESADHSGQGVRPITSLVCRSPIGFGSRFGRRRRPQRRAPHGMPAPRPPGGTTSV